MYEISKKANRFLLGQEDWWVFDHLLHEEEHYKINATFHFYADPRRKTLKSWFFDPGYNLMDLKFQNMIQQIQAAGHEIGLHPGFDTWQDTKIIESAKKIVEQSSSQKVTSCRQHWLRFSWNDTWAAQSSAGLSRDTTLMFNDRPGFRNSSALRWQPYNSNHAAKHNLTSLPTLFMDSHFYDYQLMSACERKSAIKHWVRECESVNGEAAVLWHPHTLTQDYGWSDGFRDTINIIKEYNCCQ